MTIERWDPFREMVSLRDRFNRLFDEASMRPGSDWLAGVLDRPAMNVVETDTNVMVELHLPGVKREDVELSLSGTTLTIKGERRAEEEVKEENYLRHEVHYGSFMRRIQLPETADVEKAEASFAEGVLKIAFPKRAEPQTKRIEVKEGAVPA
jgi:HSP20 family protein